MGISLPVVPAAIIRLIRNTTSANISGAYSPNGVKSEASSPKGVESEAGSPKGVESEAEHEITNVGAQGNKGRDIRVSEYERRQSVKSAGTGTERQSVSKREVGRQSATIIHNHYIQRNGTYRTP